MKYFSGRVYKKTITILSLFSTFLVFCSCVKKEEKALVVYAYDSFASEWGPGPKVVEEFSKVFEGKVEIIPKGDSGQALSAAIAEKGAPRADILIGIDQNTLRRAISSGILEAYRPKGFEKINKKLILDESFRVIPYDYGYFSIIWDSLKLVEAPKSLEDLTNPNFKGKLILLDPRTSGPGLGFLAWTIAAYGDSYAEYWKRLRPSVLTVTSGWDEGYGMFTNGEAPLVLSYTTSPAYHLENEGTERYRSLPFPEGHPIQIEGAGLLIGAKHPKAAKEFLDFMLSTKFQDIIPLTNWMYPVNGEAKLPESYRLAPIPEKTLLVDQHKLLEAQGEWAAMYSALK